MTAPTESILPTARLNFGDGAADEIGCDLAQLGARAGIFRGSMSLY